MVVEEQNAHINVWQEYYPGTPIFLINLDYFSEMMEQYIAIESRHPLVDFLFYSRMHDWKGELPSGCRYIRLGEKNGDSEKLIQILRLLTRQRV